MTNQIKKADIIEYLKNDKKNIDQIRSFFDCDLDYIKKLLDSLIDDNIITFYKKDNRYGLNKKKKYSFNEYNLSTDTIIESLKECAKPLNIISHELGSSLNDAKLLLDELINDDKVYKINSFYGEKYALIIEGTISKNSVGDLYFKDENYNLRIKDNDNNIYDGDLVRIFNDGENSHIIKLLEHSHKFVVGIFKKKSKTNKKTNITKTKYFIKSTMNRFDVDVIINEEDISNLVPDMILKADLIYQEDGTIVGKNIKVIGHKDDPGIDITEIALEYGFELEFPDEVMEETNTIPDYVYDIKGRVDYRNKKIFTIDGDDSKDFDDAISLEILDNGNYSLGVYIADVSNYVKWESPLDKEALKRGTSVYLADRVIPMLPHKLSNGICSLNENEDRLVLACIMEINKNGKLINYDINEGVIKSIHRMTYSNVNKIFDGDNKLIDKYNDIYEDLLNMKDLAEVLRNLRLKKGALEFDELEYKFNLDDNGKPIEIIKRERGISEKLIESFMLMANETVAYHMNIMNLPIVYRVHEKPIQDKLHETFNEIKTMGVDVKNIKNDIHSKEIQNILREIENNPNRFIISNMLLRSMMKAKYMGECLGHYGLAMNYYCHFTSPIRRYPDLMTHRMVKELLLHPKNDFDKKLKYYSSVIPEVSLRSSKAERRAIDCERAVDDMLSAWYMKDFIGDEFDGIITSITSFGIFVQIKNGIEGLILYKNCYGYYSYDSKNHQAVSFNKTYNLGDKVKVKLVSSNKLTKEIDFIFKEDSDYYYGEY